MRKNFKILVVSLMLMTITCIYAATVNMSKTGVTVTTNENFFKDYYNNGYSITSEGALLKAIYDENLLNGQTGYGITNATYAALTVSTTESVLGVKKGSIISTKHSTTITAIVSAVARTNGVTTITVGGWHENGNLTTTTPAITTGVGFYVCEWLAQKPLKYKKLTTTTAVTTNTAVVMPHGVTASKILSIRAKIINATDSGVYSGNNDTTKQFDVTHDATNVIITVSNTGTAVTSKAVTALVEYEE